MTFTVLQRIEDKTSKLVNLWISAKVCVYDFVKIWKWQKLLNSVKFFIKTRVNHVYNWILSFWMTFTVLQWMKTNFKIIQFSSFLLRSRFAILVKIWKWLKRLNSVLLINKTLVNHVDDWFWLFRLTFAVLHWIKTNLKISKFEDFCWGMRYWSKFENDWNFLTLFHSSKKFM